MCGNTETGISDIDNFSIASCDGNKAILTKVSTGVSNELYISNYENGSWSEFKPYSDFGKYIRSYDTVMNEDGNVTAVYNLLELEEGENGQEITDTASIIAAGKCDYYDIAVSSVYYDEENVAPGETSEFTFDVNNMSDTLLESVHIKITDNHGNICTEQDIECSIPAWSSAELTFSYTFPDLIEFSEYELSVTASDTEEDLSNNTVSTQIGFADLSIENAEVRISDSGKAMVRGQIVNNGYCETDNTMIYYYDQDDTENAVSSESIGAIAPGERKEFEFELPEDLIFTDEYYMLNSISMMTESDTAELNYANNEDKIVLKDFIENKIAVVDSHSVTLGGDIGVNYYVYMAEDIEDPVMTAWIDGNEPTELSGVKDTLGRYKFTYEVAAPQMSDKIICEFSGTRNGEKVTSGQYEYSVQKYAETALLSETVTPDLKQLAADMLNYGAYSQILFDYNTDNLANKNLEALGYSTEVDLNAVDENAVEGFDDFDGEILGEFTTNSLIMRSKTSIKFYMDLDADADAENAYLAYRLKNSDDAMQYVPLTYDGSRYFAAVSDIDTPYLSDYYEVCICVKTGTEYVQISKTKYYSAECYAAKAVKTDNQKLSDAAAAMMKYCKSARKYFNL